MRIVRSSVSRSSATEASLFVTVVFTAFVAVFFFFFALLLDETRLPRRFLSLSAHFLEISRLAAIAALRTAQTDTSTCHDQSCCNMHTLIRRHQSPFGLIHAVMLTLYNPSLWENEDVNVVPAIVPWLSPDQQS